MIFTNTIIMSSVALLASLLPPMEQTLTINTLVSRNCPRTITTIVNPHHQFS
jgi:hypothetical protein